MLTKVKLQKKRERKAAARRYLLAVKRMAQSVFGDSEGEARYQLFKKMRRERKGLKLGYKRHKLTFEKSMGVIV